MAVSYRSSPHPFFNLHSILQSSYLALEIEDQSTSCLMAFKNHFNYAFILVEKIKLWAITLFESDWFILQGIIKIKTSSPPTPCSGAFCL